MDVRTELDSRIKRAPEITAFLGMLIVLATAVLLVACANVAGLLTSRAPARARETALRVAIGANRGEVLRMVLRQGFVLALTGMLVGLALSVAATRLLRAVFPGDSPLAAYLLVTPVVFAVTMLAAYLPARRASRVDPMRALRYE